MKRNKKLAGKAVAVAAIAFAVAASPGAYAAAANGQAAYGQDAILAVSGTKEAASQSVPLRQVAQTLGAQVIWKQADKSATLLYGDTTVVLQSGKDTAIVNGKSVRIGQPVQTIKGSMYISLNFLNETFGTQARWQADKSALVFEQQDYQGKAAAFIYHLFNGGKQEGTQLLNANLQPALPGEAFDFIAAQYPQLYGSPVRLLTAAVQTNAVHTNATLVYETNIAPLQITVRFDADGLVDDLAFDVAAGSVAYQKPAYDTGLYKEQEVVVGEGTFALPGTLTLPEGTGPFPVVVLVHGSGPHDRDSTISGTKVFKDLSAGLASKGVAVLRYEKVTKEHTFKIATQPKFTIKQESVDDTLHAIELLQGIKEIDSSRIFVAGHSQGGYVMPTLLDNVAKDAVAGAILLSAPSENLTTVLVEQQNEVLERMRELKLPDEQIAAQQQAAAAWTQIVEQINDPAYSADKLPPAFPLQPAYYWFEQRDYDPAAVAQKQTTPLLIMQGENDWQVTMNQFDGWKQALAARSDVTFKSYPHVNHLLTEYKSLSVGMEYGQPANVSADIVQDIADWIVKAAK
jgi:dienelactone hydrolase